MAVRKPNPQVQAARQQARAQAQQQGLGPNRTARAGRQAAQQTRQSMRTTPQPPPVSPAPPAPAAGGGGQGGYYQYTPTAESQINQPYQDLAAAGAYGALGNAYGNYQGGQQMLDIYGQGAAQNLGGAQQGMNQLAPLGGQYTGASGNILNNYNQLLGGNQNIQQQLANEIQGIQAGKLDVDPELVQRMGQQQRDLNSQLMRQLGPDAGTSSAGIEAQGRFQQGWNDTLASANYNRLLGLIGAQQGGMQNLQGAGLGYGQFGAGIQGQQFGQGQGLGTMFGAQNADQYNQAMGFRQNQLGGASQMLGQTGQIQSLYANPAVTLGQFGGQMAGQSGAAVNAQQPYAQDRYVQLGTQYAPTSGQMWGQGLQNSGNRWASIGAATMGGSSPGGPPSNPYGNTSTNSGLNPMNSTYF